MPRSPRRAQESPRSEDYLETVYHLIEDKGYANTVDISESLRVKPSTVSLMVEKLAGKGYVEHEPYRGMRLTAAGRALALSVIRRHTIISEFLGMLGVEGSVAYEDTEGIEHHVQPLTIYRIERFVQFMRKNPKYLKLMRKFVEKGTPKE